MTTTASAPTRGDDTRPSLAHADKAVSCGERIVHHAEIEQTNVIADVMGTLTPAESLTWADSWAWAAPAVQPDGSIKVKIHTSWEGVKGFYSENRGRYQVEENGRPHVRLCSDWYAMMESNARFHSVPEGNQYFQTWVLVSPMDGSEGITGEIVWSRFPQLEPRNEPDGISPDAYDAYLAALRAQDVDALLALMSDQVQGGVRDYAGPQQFVAIDGKAAMRDHYERLFATIEVEAIDTVQFLNRGWYMFCEHRWRVTYKTGPRAGVRGALLIAELLPLDQDGRIYARLGFGTDLLTRAGGTA